MAQVVPLWLRGARRQEHILRPAAAKVRQTDRADAYEPLLVDKPRGELCCGRIAREIPNNANMLGRQFVRCRCFDDFFDPFLALPFREVPLHTGSDSTGVMK